MESIYYNPKHVASFRGVKALSKASGKSLKETSDYLKKERAYSLHKPSRRNLKKFRKYRVPFYGYQFQADLIDVQKLSEHNNGFKYILTVVDIFSRYAWIQPLKTKHGVELVKAFEKIHEKPMYLQTDLGTEFYNVNFKKYLKKHNIKLFSVHSPQKAAIVERFNKTIKTRLYRYFTYKNTKKWIDVIQDFVDSYNDTIHSTHKFTPSEASKFKNNLVVWQTQEKDRKITKPKFRIDDDVRISKRKATFFKGYESNWTEEIFKVHSIDRKNSPVMYVLIDYKNEVLNGKFYGLELQKVYRPAKYPIEKIYKQIGRRYLVKFLGYPEKYWTSNITNG